MKKRHFRSVIRHFMAIMPVILLLAFVSSPVLAQEIAVDFGSGGSASGRIIQLVLVMTIISLAPSILVMVTSFTRIIIVLSFVRNAIGIQTTPPNQVLVALALFLTFFIMSPVLQKSYDEGILPLIEERITEEEALSKAAQPFRIFMLEQVRPKDLRLFMDIRNLKLETPESTPYEVLIPAFMISELRRAFEMGFLVFVPFLIIDLLISSMLMAMGMMMLPPVIISLPFKIIFFVLVDGWYMLTGSLVRSFGPIGGG
jgi:flagellar biosynthetic protein FliP